MRICSWCGRENADDTPACRECGAKFALSDDGPKGEPPTTSTPVLKRGSGTGLNHEWALAFATCHFALSLLIGVACLLYFWSGAMSDSALSSPSWIKLSFALLWVLQTPAAIVETLTLRHFQHDADSLLLGAMGVLWSIALGYVVPFLIRCIGSPDNRKKGDPS
jgi:hypothetical protein